MNKKSKKEQIFILLAIFTVCLILFVSVGCSLTECAGCLCQVNEEKELFKDSTSLGCIGCNIEKEDGPFGGKSTCTDCSGCILGCETSNNKLTDSSYCQIFGCSKCFIYECDTGDNDITCGSNCAGCSICGGIKN